MLLGSRPTGLGGNLWLSYKLEKESIRPFQVINNRCKIKLSFFFLFTMRRYSFLRFFYDFFNVIYHFNFIFLLYNTVLVLPYIDMNLPQVYMSSQP